MRVFRSVVLAVVAAVSLGLASAGAVADGVYRGAPPVERYAYVPFSWRGFYVGLHAGYGWGDGDHAITGSPFWATGPDGSGAFAQDLSGRVVGGHAGYNFTSGPFVFGAEASISGGGLGENGTITPFFPASDRWAVEVDWYATLTGRIGYAFDRVLIYAKGGYAGGEIDSRVADSVFAFAGACTAGTCKAGASEWHHGWTAGGGLEYAVLRNLVLGIEYNYVDLGSATHATATSGTAGTVFLSESVDIQFQTITARLTFKLN